MSVPSLLDYITQRRSTISAFFEREVFMNEVSFWNDDDLHYEIEQLDRQSSALFEELTPIEIDRSNKTGIIQGPSWGGRA